MNADKPKEVALDEHIALLAEEAECNDAIKAWTKRREKLKARLAEIMGDAKVGTVGGEKVVSYDYKESFRSKDFATDYPDMAKLYTREVTRTAFDVEWFRFARPDLYEEYKVREMRSTFRSA